MIRKTFSEGAIDDLVSTRRIEHIVNAYAMFNDRLKAIELCVNRFDEDTRAAFIDLYTKVDAGLHEDDELVVGQPSEDDLADDDF